MDEFEKWSRVPSGGEFPGPMLEGIRRQVVARARLTGMPVHMLQHMNSSSTMLEREVSTLVTMCGFTPNGAEHLHLAQHLQCRGVPLHGAAMAVQLGALARASVAGGITDDAMGEQILLAVNSSGGATGKVNLGMLCYERLLELGVWQVGSGGGSAETSAARGERWLTGKEYVRIETTGKTFEKALKGGEITTRKWLTKVRAVAQGVGEKEAADLRMRGMDTRRV